MSNQLKIGKWQKGALLSLLMGSLFCAANGKNSPIQVSMERIQAIGSAVESFKEETGALPEAKSIADLRSLISPRFLPVMSTRDGWNNELQYITLESGGNGRRGDYWIGSSGGESPFGGFLKYILKIGTQPTDIIFHNGHFIQTPKKA